MSFTVIRTALVAGVAAFAMASQALAHHSFASEFDRDQPFTVEGAVNHVEWTNPHGWLLVDVEEDGEMITYRIELASPSTLMRQGWRRNDLVEGDKIKITGFRARTRHNVGRATGISRENGEAIYGLGID